MREIKFRGKRLDGKGWAFGHLVKMWGEWHIIDWNDENTAYPVDPDTVGQYTEQKDKNGKEIYEGDIINWLMHRMDRTGYIEEGRVEFRTNEQATVVINKFATKDGRESVRNILNCLNDLKVIGNIHDNPELMKGGDQ